MFGNMGVGFGRLGKPSTLEGGGGQPLRVVAAAQRMPQSWAAAPSGKLSIGFQQQSILGGTISDFVLVLLNWANINSVDTQNTNAVTISAVWMERISTGQVVPITFGGSRSLIMAAASSVVRYLADAVPASVWTGSPVTRGEVFRVTGKGSVPATGNQVPRSRYANVPLAGSDCVWFDSATDVTGIDYSGAFVRPTAAVTTNWGNRGFCPIVAGHFSAPGFVAAGAVGDSIFDGLQEQGAQTNSGQGPFEYINRLDTGTGYMPPVIDNINKTMATLMMAFSGERYPLAASIANWSLRIPLLAELTNVVVDEFGTNNFQSASTGNPTDTPANVELRRQAVYAAIRAAKPGMPILKTKLLPITNSNPIGGPSKASQTPAYDWVAAGKVDQWHALLAAAVGVDITTFLDTRAPVDDPTDEHYWISNGTTNYWVAETGTDPTPLTHPYAQTSVLIAPVIRAALDAYAGLVN